MTAAIIPAIPADTSWQQQLQQMIRDPRELFALLELDPSQLPETLRAGEDFELRVPRPFAERMGKGDSRDPLLQQVLPRGLELEHFPGYSADPLDEKHSNPLKGLIHKYHGRVLLVVNGQCAIHCRYCFRRHFPYGDNRPSRQDWQRVFDYIAADPSINEVIFSGGDPLSSSDRLLGWLVEELEQLPQLSRLRIHTRLPIVLPQRVDQQLLAWLEKTRFNTVMVLHCNHGNEIDGAVARAADALRSAGTHLLNQAVLLKGVNDSLESQVELSEKLFAAGILPYYLHQLDAVAGAAHFAVSDGRARRLHARMQARLPGFLLPRLVRERPGEASKSPL